jgi:predicted PurR-regulated permease PerM
MRTWMRRPDEASHGPDGAGLEPNELAGLFTAPKWLRDLGLSAWLAVGVTLAVVGLVWILSLTDAIVTPVITAAVIAAVASPLLRKLERHRVPRGVAAALFIVAFLVLAILVALVVVGGITGQGADIRSELRSAKDTLTGWATDAGVAPDAAANARDDISTAVGDAVPALLAGLGEGLRKLSSLIVFLGLTFLSTFFLLKDGPHIRRWAERHMGMPQGAAHAMTQRVLEALRGYFVGVTAVAVFNGVVVGVGALILGVPLAGTIALITFLGAYVPYLGAWTAAIFSVLVALGGAGADAAAGMIVVQLLANGILQQMIQPIAYGAALGIHPLAVLIVTIAGGSLFGAVGLILAAPLTSAATRIAADLARGRSDAPPAEGGRPPPAQPAAPAL